MEGVNHAVDRDGTNAVGDIGQKSADRTVGWIPLGISLLVRDQIEKDRVRQQAHILDLLKLLRIEPRDQDFLPSAQIHDRYLAFIGRFDRADQVRVLRLKHDAVGDRCGRYAAPVVPAASDRRPTHCHSGGGGDQP